jgi:putative membrane-bound dehydrogenase-like protein
MICFCVVGTTTVAQDDAVRFERIVLSREFNGEGACFADINGDGISDAVSGPYWYAGPQFERKHRFAAGGSYPITGYSDFFFNFADDFDGDGDTDILSIPMPGTLAFWHENPGQTDDEWVRHKALDNVGGESPALADITGDGRRELICVHDEAWGYAEPTEPTGDGSQRPWTFTSISNKRALGRFTHGLGVGDINSDGRLDLLERTGWWSQPAAKGEPFTFRKFPFAQSGGSQMFAYDFDGDGDNDVVSVQNAHAWGLSWFERRGDGNDVSFLAHEILPNTPNADGSRFNISQMHALALADMDGDGIKDIITGKRYFAHNGNDPGAHQLPLLVWFKTIRDAGGVRFEPHVIDKTAGVGTQLTVEDINGDKRPDIIVGNKRGTVVLINRASVAGPEMTLADTDKQVGTNKFAAGVRETEWLSPADELATFVLPPGFEATLVASEPDIAKPMNMAFDSKGRLWVSSSTEYPYPAPKDRVGRDTIKVLEDANSDGRFEKITTFADKLNIPMGLYPYKDGVVCFSIPNIWFLRDTDGDGRADKREKLYGPMGFERDTHGMCNAFTRGYDGWLYACHGFNNHTTVGGSDGHEIKMQSGNTFRMRLDGSRIEHFTHGLVNPFGMIFDEYGDQFVADCHTKPVNMLMRNGYYDSFGKPHDGLGYVPDVMNHLHGSTAIGGIAQVTGNSFPAAFERNVFGGNVMTSRINRNSLQRTGSTVRATEEPDFLIAGDPWFRPVDLQFGPDGALYVADFYNRIIGHYEVKLDHPGRDRKSGRIWRIAYVGKEVERPGEWDVKWPLPDRMGARVVGGSKLPNMTARMLSMNRLLDNAEDVGMARQMLGSVDSNHVIHSLWILARKGEITSEQIQQAAKHRDDRVRTHVQRIVETLPASKDNQETIRRGLRDASPMVRRMAAIAASSHMDVLLLPELLSAFRSTPSDDVHLRHALRMALRDHLRNEDWFKETMASVEQQDVPVLAGICLALKTEHAGEFLARNLNLLPTKDPEQFTEYLKFASRYVSPELVDEVVAVARGKFAEDTDLQLELIRSVDVGLRERGTERPESLTVWASDLATQLLAVKKNQTEPLSWTFVGMGSTQNPWLPSTKRNSADGQQASLLHSSFPTGESRTGMYRSDPFRLDEQFSFFIAGHDGYPDKPLQKKNYVCMRDATSHAVVQTWYPPRNDTAQRFQLSAARRKETEVYLELVDGDDAGAYAWLAVGRFSNTRLNPIAGVSGNRHKGISLVEDMRLESLKPSLLELMDLKRFGSGTAVAAARAFAGFSKHFELKAVAEAAGFDGVSGSLRNKCVKAVAKSQPELAAKLLPQVMQTATSREQSKLSTQLASTADGSLLLLAMLEEGHVGLRVLQGGQTGSRLAVRANPGIRKRVAKLLKDVPSERVGEGALIEARIAEYLKTPGDQNRGAALFTANCAVCHQVAGRGKQVGPNLDGIGTRGLNRLAEDVLAPNRNVDINFHATTLVTDDGKVHTGLLRPTTGALTVIVNSDGKEIRVPTESIDQKTTSRLSPMPGNVTEKLSPAEFNDLMAYLLSLGN